MEKMALSAFEPKVSASTSFVNAWSYSLGRTFWCFESAVYVVSIPPVSLFSRCTAAKRIQAFVRGFRVRKNLKRMDLQRKALLALEAAIGTRDKTLIMQAVQEAVKHGMGPQICNL